MGTVQECICRRLRARMFTVTNVAQAAEGIDC